MKRRFKITRAEVGNWSTGFSIQDLDHTNPDNSMSPDALVHHLGNLAGLALEKIEGLEFTIELKAPDIKPDRFDPLDLCGKTIGTG